MEKKIRKKFIDTNKIIELIFDKIITGIRIINKIIFINEIL